MLNAHPHLITPPWTTEEMLTWPWNHEQPAVLGVLSLQENKKRKLNFVTQANGALNAIPDVRAELGASSLDGKACSQCALLFRPVHLTRSSLLPL